MTFKKGDPRPPGAGRKKGSGNKLTFDIKQSLMLHGPALAAELVRIAMTARNESTRVLAIKECFDRIAGKASQHVQGQLHLRHKRRVGEIVDATRRQLSLNS
jgi:hypothetical protein